MPRRPKLLWLLPLVIAGLVALLGWWGDHRLREIIESELRDDLRSTLDANVSALEIWTTNQMKMANLLAEEPTVRMLSARLVGAPGTNLDDATPASDLDDFGAFLRPRLNRMGYEMAQLVGTNFMVAATTTRNHAGVGLPVPEIHTNKFSELFERDEPIVISPFKPELFAQRRLARLMSEARDFNYNLHTNRFRRAASIRFLHQDTELMQVAAPVHGRGGVIGALTLNINPTNEFSRILGVAHRGDSGETYAFDQSGLLISPCRHDLELRQIGLLHATNDSSALNLRLHDPGGDMTQGYRPEGTNVSNPPLVRFIANAVAGDTGVSVVPMRDYRGVPVVCAWRWLPHLGFGVATEQDASEAFWLLRVLQFIFVILFLLLVLCSIVLFVFSYVNFTSLRRLRAAELKLEQLGQYTLEEKIGSGSMGVVYRARHALMRRDTAVKLLLPELADPVSVERFIREVHLTCQLAHPNTIQIYDYGHTPEGVFYYAMEFLTGLNLHQLVDEFGPQPEGRAINILVQICNSLAEAHAAGLIHRDIKPSNVFLTDRGGVPDYVKVLDFGLVREFRTGKNNKKVDNEMAGTPWFMPPEAIQKPAESDPRSDLYSLGGLAYYLVTGKYVFDHDSADEVMEHQLKSLPAPPSGTTRNVISPELEAIILRCLEKDPALRPQSAMELAALLANCPRADESTPESRNDWWRMYHARQETVPAPEGPTTEDHMTEVRINLESHIVEHHTEVGNE
jgi:serine/threonine protein kinase